MQIPIIPVMAEVSVDTITEYLNHETAEHLIKEADLRMADMDFTLMLAKYFVKEILESGQDDYINDIKRFLKKSLLK